MAFEPAENVNISSMILCAIEAVGKEYFGYKGGRYVMTEYTNVHLAYYGSCGEEIDEDLLEKLLSIQNGKVVLSVSDKERFSQWIIENVNSNVVPRDEGDGDALRYNLVHLVKGDGKEYDYLPEQDKEIESWEKF